jgi:hypothetical protein
VLDEQNVRWEMSAETVKTTSEIAKLRKERTMETSAEESRNSAETESETNEVCRSSVE